MKFFSVVLVNDSPGEIQRAETRLRAIIVGQGEVLANYRFVRVVAWDIIEHKQVERLDAYEKDHFLARAPEARAYPAELT